MNKRKTYLGLSAVPLHTHICMYVCKSFIYTHTYIHTHKRASGSLPGTLEYYLKLKALTTCIQAYIHMHIVEIGMCAYMYVCMYAFLKMHVRTYVHINNCMMYVHTHMYVNYVIHMCMHTTRTRMYAYTCTYICTYIRVLYVYMISCYQSLKSTNAPHK